MGFHDDLAEGARREGETSEQFYAAAQRHADSFWRYAVIGAAVWYFFSLGWALIPFAVAGFVIFQSISATLVARKLKQLRTAVEVPSQFDLHNPAHVSLMDEIRRRYSALLANKSTPYARCLYRPASDLPYDRELIERALTDLLDYVEGRKDSSLFDESIRNSEVADTIRSGMQILEFFIDIAPEELPTTPGDNVRVGSRLRKAQS